MITILQLTLLFAAIVVAIAGLREMARVATGRMYYIRLSRMFCFIVALFAAIGGMWPVTLLLAAMVFVSYRNDGA